MTVDLNWRDGGLYCAYKERASFASVSLAVEKITTLLAEKSARFIIHDLSRCTNIELGVAALFCFSATSEHNADLISNVRIAVITTEPTFALLVTDLQHLVKQEIACFDSLKNAFLWLNKSPSILGNSQK